MSNITKFIIVIVLVASLMTSVEPASCAFTSSSYNGPRERYIVFLKSESAIKHYQWLKNCLNRSTQKLSTADFSIASSIERDNVVDFSVDEKAHGYTAWFDAKFVEEQLSSRPETVVVEKDALVSINAAILAADTTQKNPTLNLDRIDQAKYPLDNRYSFPKSAGAGVTVYVIDTGVLVSHNEFEGRAKFGGSFCSNCPKTDDNGHGSHVAGIIAGKTFGVAKKADIVGIKVLPASGRGSNADVINGLMFALEDHKKKNNTAVVNMSLGSELSKAMDEAVKSLTDDGVHVVVAAGNIASDACKSSPSAERSAITVGATEDTFDSVTDFSNFGKCVDIFAPGRDIMSVGIGHEDDTAVFSGTSQAAPHVAGALALIIGENGNSSPAKMQKTLLDLATKDVLNNVPKDSPNRLLRVPQ